MTTIDIGADFSVDPLGRFRTDGNASGEAFREDILWPTLKNLKPEERLTIVLDNGVESYGSSFLTEGFAGIVKYGYMPADEFLAKIDFTYRNAEFSFYEKKIRKYCKDAKHASKVYQRG